VRGGNVIRLAAQSGSLPIFLAGLNVEKTEREVLNNKIYLSFNVIWWNLENEICK
jgi:hypothetical protein